jgi:hypothetical protein
LLARDPSPGRPAVAWLTLSPRGLLVVPRMSAMTGKGELEAAITSAGRTAWAQPKWLHRPSPL